MPTATETASAVALPDPGGTCRASQFIGGLATSYYDYSTAFSRVANAWLPLTNSGDDCVLAVPTAIAMAGATGPFVAVSWPNAGQQICKENACKSVYPASYEVHSGQSIRLELRAWWPWDPAAPSPRPKLCDHPIVDVTRAEFPFASGRVALTWDIAFHEVCASAGSVGITVATK